MAELINTNEYNYCRIKKVTAVNRKQKKRNSRYLGESGSLIDRSIKIGSD